MNDLKSVLVFTVSLVSSLFLNSGFWAVWSFCKCLDSAKTQNEVISRSAQFSISPVLKCTSRIKVVILVVSRPYSLGQRQSIRETWYGNIIGKNVFTRIYFLIGMPKNEIPSMLYQEAEDHGDIILAQLHESYRQLTLKTVIGFIWVEENCDSVQYLMKLDDDVILFPSSFFALIAQLGSEDQVQPRIYGRCWSRGTPNRNAKQRWYVSWTDWPELTMPFYCSGHAYLLNSAALTKFCSHVHLSNPNFPLEDAYITGVWAEELNMTRVNNDDFWIEISPRDACLENALTVHRLKTPRSLKQFWISFNAYCRIY